MNRIKRWCDECGQGHEIEFPYVPEPKLQTALIKWQKDWDAAHAGHIRTAGINGDAK